MFVWFLILIAYIPFQIALNPGFGFDFASVRVFIISLFSFFIIKGLVNRNLFKDNYFFNLQSICLIAFLALACFSLINAENIFWGIRKIIFFLSVFPVYFLTIALINNWQKIKKVISILVMSSGLVALVGLLQFLSQFVFGLENVYVFWAWNILPVFSGFNLGAMILAYPSWLVNIGGETIMRVFSIFSDPHMFSFYVGLSLPLVIFLFYQIIKKKGKKFSIFNFQFSIVVLFFVLYFTLLLTFVRGAYFAVIVSFLALAFLFWKYLNDKKIAFLLCLSLLIFIIPGTPIADRFYTSFNLDEGSNMGRLEMWQRAGEIGMNSFWSGIGLGNYSLAIEANFDYRNPATAHNLYLDIFSETGFLGLIIWLILILGSIWQIFRKIRQINNKKHKIALICLIGSLIYFSVHSFFETAIYQPSVLALLMIVFGLTTILLKNVSENN